MIKKAEHINTVEGSVIFPIPQLNRVDILNLEREGITIFLEDEFTEGTLEAEVYYAKVKYKKSVQNKPGDMFQVSFGSGYRSRKFQLIGDNPALPGLIYSVTILGVDSRYEVQPGDTEEDILNGLADAINNAIFNVAPPSASVADSRLVITASPLAVPIWDIIYLDNYVFKTAYFTFLNVFGQQTPYIITEEQSNINYTDLGPLLSSYNFSTLTQFTGTINEYLKPAGYTTTFVPYYIIGNTDITNALLFPSTTSRAVHDQPNSRIVYHPSSPQKVNERSLILYR